MIRGGFSELADTYDALAAAERAAGERLLDLVAVGPRDFILDVGCGTGALTVAARRRCKGKIVGIDLSSGMVRRARWHAQQPDVSFVLGDAAAMPYERNFNVVLLNSSLHWMADPERVLQRCFHALRRGGWIGIQTPATRDWCPLARGVVAAAQAEAGLASVMERYRNPMFILPDMKAYEDMLDRAVIDVYDGRLETETVVLSVEDALGALEVQVGPALFNPDCYAGGLTDAEMARLRAFVREVVADKADAEGRVAFAMTRAFLYGSKQWNERRLMPQG